jgi:dTDP-4-dehydrorhamnose 3,5-epimerase-like enzyme
MTTVETKTFGQLTQGTVVNFYRPVTADDTKFVVLRHFEDRWGSFTEVLNLETFEKDSFTQHSKIENHWSIVKEN